MRSLTLLMTLLQAGFLLVGSLPSHSMKYNLQIRFGTTACLKQLNPTIMAGFPVLAIILISLGITGSLLPNDRDKIVLNNIFFLYLDMDF